MLNKPFIIIQFAVVIRFSRNILSINKKMESTINLKPSVNAKKKQIPSQGE